MQGKCPTICSTALASLLLLLNTLFKKLGGWAKKNEDIILKLVTKSGFLQTCCFSNQQPSRLYCNATGLEILSQCIQKQLMISEC